VNTPPPRDTRERAFEFACDVVRFCQKLSQKRACWSIADQLLRAGTGVAANAEEAKVAYSRREFALKNNYALKEARESQLWLRLIVRCQLSDDEAEAKRLLQEAGELTGILTATVRSTRRNL
jgi:four helix bundle protein